MNVGELKVQLEGVPDDVWVDAMFPNGADAYHVTGTELVELPDGRKILVLDIEDSVPLKAV